MNKNNGNDESGNNIPFFFCDECGEVTYTGHSLKIDEVVKDICNECYNNTK